MKQCEPVGPKAFVNAPYSPTEGVPFLAREWWVAKFCTDALSTPTLVQNLER